VPPFLLFLLPRLLAFAAAPPDTTPGLELVRVLAAAEGGLSDDRFVDAGVGADGTVFALTGNGTIRRFRAGAPLSSWAGPGMDEGRFVRPEALALGRGAYVLESGTLTELDSTGAPTARRRLPFSLAEPVSLAVAPDGMLLVSAVAGNGPAADVFAFCPALDCPVRRFGVVASDSLSGARERTPGLVAVHGDTVVYASLWRYRIVRYVPGSDAPGVLVEGDLLAVSASTADSSHTLGRAGMAPRATGLVPLRGGGFVYSAFFPARGASMLQFLNASGNVVLSAELPIYLRAEGELPNGDLLFLRIIKDEQLVIYRLVGLDLSPTR
jgi:hypothetical protein